MFPTDFFYSLPNAGRGGTGMLTSLFRLLSFSAPSGCRRPLPKRRRSVVKCCCSIPGSLRRKRGNDGSGKTRRLLSFCFSRKAERGDSAIFFRKQDVQKSTRRMFRAFRLPPSFFSPARDGALRSVRATGRTAVTRSSSMRRERFFDSHRSDGVGGPSFAENGLLRRLFYFFCEVCRQ